MAKKFTPKTPEDEKIKIDTAVPSTESVNRSVRTNPVRKVPRKINKANPQQRPIKETSANPAETGIAVEEPEIQKATPKPRDESKFLEKTAFGAGRERRRGLAGLFGVRPKPEKEVNEPSEATTPEELADAVNKRQKAKIDAKNGIVTPPPETKTAEAETFEDVQSNILKEAQSKIDALRGEGGVSAAVLSRNIKEVNKLAEEEVRNAELEFGIMSGDEAGDKISQQLKRDELAGTRSIMANEGDSFALANAKYKQRIKHDTIDEEAGQAGEAFDALTQKEEFKKDDHLGVAEQAILLSNNNSDKGYNLLKSRFGTLYADKALKLWGQENGYSSEAVEQQSIANIAGSLASGEIEGAMNVGNFVDRLRKTGVEDDFIIKQLSGIIASDNSTDKTVKAAQQEMRELLGEEEGAGLGNLAAAIKSGTTKFEDLRQVTQEKLLISGYLPPKGTDLGNIDVEKETFLNLIRSGQATKDFIGDLASTAIDQGWQDEYNQAVKEGRPISEKEANELNIPFGSTRGESNAIVRIRQLRGLGNKRYQGDKKVRDGVRATAKTARRIDKLEGLFNEFEEKGGNLNNIMDKSERGAGGLFEKLGGGTPEQLELFRQINAIAGENLADFVKEMSGAAVSEQEYQRLQEFKPNVAMSNNQFKNELKRFKDEFEINTGSMASEYGFDDRDFLYRAGRGEVRQFISDDELRNFMETGSYDPVVGEGGETSEATELQSLGISPEVVDDYETMNALNNPLVEEAAFSGMSKEKQDGIIKYAEYLESKKKSEDLSGDLINNIKGEEGFKSEAYLDQGGVPTIGYGFTKINGKPVEIGDKISEKDAESELQKQVEKYKTWENKTKISLTPEQENALTSFTYNLGAGIWDKYPNMIKLLNEKKFDKFAQELVKFNQYKDQEDNIYKVSTGLANRRKREARAFSDKI